MSSKTDFFENAVLNVLRGTNITAPVTVYVGLFTVMPADDGTGSTEVSGGSYARQAVTFAAPAGGQVQNSGEVSFPVASALWGDVKGWGIFDALTVGNLLYYAKLGDTPFDFQALAASDIFTAVGHTFINGDEVVLSGTALPGGSTDGTKYFVRDVSGNTFKLAATADGSAIDATTDGAGIVQKDLRKTIASGDQAKFAVNDLKVAER